MASILVFILLLIILIITTIIETIRSIIKDKSGNKLKKLISGIIGISIGCAISYINRVNIIFGNVLLDESIINPLGSQLAAAMDDILGILSIFICLSTAIFFMFKPVKLKRSSMAILAVIILNFPTINEPIAILKLALSCGILAIFHEGPLKAKIIDKLEQVNL